MPSPLIALSFRCSRIGIAIACVLALAACSGSVGSATPAATTPPPDQASSPPAGTAAPTDSVPLDAPPAAAMFVEGGDPVAGQLGTYVWGDGGSDSPWLPGAPITVGVGERAAVTFTPGVSVASWRARFLPSTADGPDRAAALGAGAGEPTFGAPPVGSWTVVVDVVFAGGLGDAMYYWLVTVG